MRIIHRTKQLLLLGGDLLALFFGMYLALLSRHFSFPSLVDIERHVPLFSAVFFLWMVTNYISGLYDLSKSKNNAFFFRRLVETAGVALVVGVIFLYLLPSRDVNPKIILVLTVLFGYGAIALWRLIFNAFLSDRTLQARVLFIGYTEEMKEIAEILTKTPQRGYTLRSWIDAESRVQKPEFGTVDVYTSIKTIRPAITNHNIDTVVIAPGLREKDDVLRELYGLLFWNVHIVNLASFYETITGRIPPFTFSESWFLDHLRNTDRAVYSRLRTVMDYIAGTMLGIFFLATLPLLAPAIRLESKGPVFIRQDRMGKFGKKFMLYKFRSMYALSKDGSAELEGVQFAKKDDKRVTRVGKFLRKTRLDELPQCINLLKRDITLIGPRPERPEIVRQLEVHMPYYSLRHIVRPGLTGWAVIHQNYTDTLETSLQKLQYDLYYIKNRSFLLDVSIVLKTVNLVVRMLGQ